jgi:hypothetical protein
MTLTEPDANAVREDAQLRVAEARSDAFLGRLLARIERERALRSARLRQSRDAKALDWVI